MADPELLEHKSADRLAFEHYLRTGQRLSAGEWRGYVERKFNPYHDERGRFTFATGAAGMADSSPAPQSGRAMRQVGRVGTRPSVRPSTPPRTRVAAMPGYPETPRTAWRSSNDLAFIAAADYYNKEHGLKPGDKGYKTPEFLKAWAMLESGGEGDEQHFRTDPFQVNKLGDWADEKTRITGLRKGQRMTPPVSAYAALEWLRHKSQIHDSNGRVVRVLSDETALENYNHCDGRYPPIGRLAS